MKKILTSVFSILLISGVVAGATGAFFTDSEVSTAAAFNGGTFTIDVNGDSDGTFEFNLGDISDIAPGDLTGTAEIIVKNSSDINAATFGRFTLSGGDGLEDVLNIYHYKVEYFNADDTLTDRWTAPDFDPYFGEAVNQDWWIKEGVVHTNFVNAGGTGNIKTWVQGNGPLDVPGTAWDMEALKPGEYYKITFQFQMDPSANNSYQNKTVNLGYEVKATQINTSAVVGLGLGGQLNDNGYVGPNVIPYLQSQVTP